VTDPEEATGDEVLPPSPSKKKRKHATSLDDDGDPAQPAEEDSPPPTPQKKPSHFGDDDEEAGSSPSSTSSSRSRSSPDYGEESPPDSRRSRPSDDYDDEESLRDDDGRRRRVRTAEEELEPEAGEEERLADDDEPGNGIAAELAFGGLWMSGATGSASSHFMAGLIVSYHIGRAAFAPESEFLHENLILELAWQTSATGTSVGTDEVRVNSGSHYLTLDVLFGFPVPPVLFYAKLGGAGDHAGHLRRAGRGHLVHRRQGRARLRPGDSQQLVLPPLRRLRLARGAGRLPARVPRRPDAHRRRRRVLLTFRAWPAGSS
jgi:hypothetical protein